MTAIKGLKYEQQLNKSEPYRREYSNHLLNRAKEK